MPLFFLLKAVNALFLRLYAVNAFIPTKKRSYRYYVFGSTQSAPLFFRLNANNAAIFPVEGRQRRFFPDKPR